MKQKIYIGSFVSDMKYEEHLIRSIKENSRHEFDIQVIRRDSDIHPFIIPKISGFEGRVIYITSRAIVLGDVMSILELPSDVAFVPAVGYNFDVCVINCDQLNKFCLVSEETISRSSWSASNLIQHYSANQQIMMGRWPIWNSQNGQLYSRDHTKIITYPDLSLCSSAVLKIIGSHIDI